VWLEQLQTLKSSTFKLQSDFQTAQADQVRAKAALDEVYAQAERCAEQVRQNDVDAEELRGCEYISSAAVTGCDLSCGGATVSAEIDSRLDSELGVVPGRAAVGIAAGF
jgi:hypothetical protein